jgi:Ni,Fe-hydrogenase III large subunit
MSSPTPYPLHLSPAQRQVLHIDIEGEGIFSVRISFGYNSSAVEVIVGQAEHPWALLLALRLSGDELFCGTLHRNCAQ